MLPIYTGPGAWDRLGLIPFHLASGVDVKLLARRGAFLVSLLIGHFGRIGPLRLNVPAGSQEPDT